MMMGLANMVAVLHQPVCAFLLVLTAACSIKVWGGERGVWLCLGGATSIFSCRMSMARRRVPQFYA